MIPVKIGEASIRRTLFDLNLKNESLVANLDLLGELWDKAQIRDEACKVRASRRYNTKVKPRSFHKGDLV